MARSPQRTVLFLALLLFLAAPLAAARHWVPLGPYGGSVYQLAVDPSNARMVYAFTEENVLFKSADGGVNWIPVRMFDSVGSPVGSIAVDPARHGTIYVATGRGLLKSVGGGASWKEVGPRSASSISAVAVDPARASRVYAGGSRIWISTNRGASWRPARSPLPTVYYVRQLIVARQPTGTVFATTTGDPGVYKSSDDGLTWSALPQPAGTHDVQAFAVAPSDSRRLYASFPGAGLFRSTDGGATWQRTGGQPATYDRVLSLAVSPHSPLTVWLVREPGGLFRSKDGGDTWVARGPRTAGRVDTVAVAPSASGTVYAGLRAMGREVGGVFASTDSGSTWVRRNRGLFGPQVTSLAIDPSESDVLWAGHPGGLYRSANGGTSWVRMALTPPPPWGYYFTSIVLDPAAPATGVYALCDSLWRSLDGGASWTDLFATGAPHPRLVSLQMGPEAAPKLWGSDEDALYASADAGINWVLKAQPELGCGILDFAFAPSSSSIMYMAGADGHWWCQLCPDPPILPNYCDDSPLPVFFRSDDGGTTWTEVSADLQRQVTDVSARRIAVDPVDPRLVYLATGGGYESGSGDGVWKSTDGGLTWSRAGDEMAGQSVTAIAASPLAGVVWASTSGRVFRSGNAGATWRNRMDGLLARGVYDLLIDPADPSRIYAATSGGVWVWTDEAF